MAFRLTVVDDNNATATGGAASGQATARVTVLDASKDPSVMPGDMEQWNADTGEAEPIESFGAMNVEFTGGNGSRLNLGRWSGPPGLPDENYGHDGEP